MTTCIKIIVVNIVVVAVLVTTLELGASLYIEPPRKHIVKSFQFNHTWKPNSSRVHKEWVKRNPDFPEPYTHYYNKQGWLETYDVKKTKPANTYRIFYLGDSHTEGTAPMSQSVPSRVEIHLNHIVKERNLDTDVEVINTGTSSYSPTLYYILYRYAIAKFKPDLIIVNLSMNDDFDDWKYSKTLIVDDDGDPYAAPPRDIYKSDYFESREQVVKATVWTRLQLLLSEHSSIYNLLLQYRTKHRSKQSETKPTSEEDDPSIYKKHQWVKHQQWDDRIQTNVDHTFSLVKKLILLAKEKNSKVMITAHPAHHQYVLASSELDQPKWSSRPHQELAKVALQNGAAYLNSFEELKPYISGTQHHHYYYKHDGHFNPRGYEIWANAHIEFLMNSKNQLLPQGFYQ